jgi:hypothetical protein
MTADLDHIIVHATDPRASAAFLAELLGTPVLPDGGSLRPRRDRQPRHAGLRPRRACCSPCSTARSSLTGIMELVTAPDGETPEG